MTIKELEERTGMARATIRFYESEGLLSPTRRANGYRDYSEEDAATLEKIKLLRALHLDLDTVRLVQRGELPLERALFTLLTRLEGDRAQLDRAAQVCRELQRAGVEWGALDPAPLLWELEAPARPAVPPASPRFPTLEEEIRRDCQAWAHPWMRLLARSTDLAIWQVGVYALARLGLGLNLLRLNAAAEWFLGLAALVLMLAAEPLLLHFWGWTPGKWLFGLKVREEDGSRLSLGAAWRRSWGVFAGGFGFHLPGYNLWRQWRCYRHCKQGEDCPWDYGEGRRYTREDRPLGWLGWLAGHGVCVFLLVLLLLHSCLPPNRGKLTAGAYFENVNYYLDFMDVYGPRLDETGSVVSEVRNGVLLYQFRGMDYQMTAALEDGAVTSVTVTETLDVSRFDDYMAWTATGRPEFYLYQQYFQAATLALAGAGGEINLFNFGMAGWAGLWEERWTDFSLSYRGMDIQQDIQQEHCRKDGGRFVLLSRDARFQRVATLTWEEGT